jgi:hypothetical protein
MNSPGLQGFAKIHQNQEGLMRFISNLTEMNVSSRTYIPVSFGNFKGSSPTSSQALTPRFG